MLLHYLKMELKAKSSDPLAAGLLLAGAASALALGGAVFLFSLTVYEFVLLFLFWSPVAVFAAAAAQLSLARQQGLDKLILANPVSAGRLLVSRAALVAVWSLAFLVLALPPMVAMSVSLGPPALEMLARGVLAYIVLVAAGTVLGSLAAVVCARLAFPLSMTVGAAMGVALLFLGTRGYHTMTGQRFAEGMLATRGPSPWSAAYEILHGDAAAALLLGGVLVVLLALAAAATWALLRMRDVGGWTRPRHAAALGAGLAAALFVLPALLPAPSPAAPIAYEGGNVGGFAFSLSPPPQGGPREVPLRKGDVVDFTPRIRATPRFEDASPRTVTLALVPMPNGPLGIEFVEVAPERQDASIVPDPAAPGSWMLTPTTWKVEVVGTDSDRWTRAFMRIQITSGDGTAYVTDSVAIEAEPTKGPLVAAAVAELAVAGWLLWASMRRRGHFLPRPAPGG